MSHGIHYPAKVAGWAYLFGAVILLTIGSWVQDMDFEAGMLITEYGLVLLPVILIGWFFKINMKSALRLKPLKLKEIILIPFTVAVALPITLFLNMLVITLMAHFGKVYEMPIPSAENLSELSMLFFIVSISAGICEEFFFRGMMLDAYSARFGAWKGIVISAVLFGLFHFNPQNLLGPIFLGLLFGYLVLITESIMAGILAHMTNNGIAVLLAYGFTRGQHPTLSQNNGIEMINSNPEQMLIALTVVGVFAVGSAIAVFGLLSEIRNGRKLFSKTEETTVRMSEIVPLALPMALYIIVSYYLIAIRH